MNFKIFQQAVAIQFKRMSAHPLFRVNADKDWLWATYLNAFPAGTNPLYRKRTEHDCSCCKSFIRTMGNVVAIIDGRVESIWDIKVDSEAYQIVANTLAGLVRVRPISDAFLHYEGHAGTERNFEQVTGEAPKTWDHFHVHTPKQFVLQKASIPTKLGEVRAHRDVFARSLDELTPDAVQTVLELIAQGSLYRGDEHKATLQKFQQAQTDYGKLPITSQNTYAWVASQSLPGPVTKLRNTSIGTLLTNLSEGMDMEQAVRAFEAMVAPANYKRPTALVTKAMIEKAKSTLNELGLTSALERRYAAIGDITINNVLYADRGTRKALGGDVFDDLVAAVPEKVKAFDKVEEVHIDKFLADILPTAKRLELMVENRHTANLVSLIAPADAGALGLFKWPNNFSWSYNGDVADSMKERVKQAGGNVTGDLCCRLAWFNYDDLDFHMMEPNGNEISFMRKHSTRTDGRLDVDMNAGGGVTREPVENIFYGDAKKMQEGTYTLYVHTFSKREDEDVGFEVEIDFKGTVHRFAYPQPVGQKGNIVVAKFSYTHKDGVEFISSLPSTQATRNVWGLNTQTFVRVNAVMLSPNYWDGRGVGNKHHFFMLDGCRNDGTARGFYNEFLKDELTPHRKVIEVVGAKMRTEQSESQLSGLGFSSTQRNSVLCRVSGKFNRVIKVTF